MIRAYKGWQIEGVGGFITTRHFWANKDARAFWCGMLRDVKTLIDRMEAGDITYDDIPTYQKQALYN